MRSTHVHFRLSSDVCTRYSAQAQAQDMALGSYLRWRLEQQDEFLADEAAMLKRSAQHAPNTTPSVPGVDSSPPQGLLVEVLLLLRSLTGLQKAAVAQKEVERRGLQVWR